MDNDSVVEQIVRSLSFEVEAIPQDNFIHLTATTKSAPLNVKIRVRKKEETGFRHAVLSMHKPDRPYSMPERVRLASSDQTIMSFNVVMEADFKKPAKKPRRNILGIFKPSICLGAEPDEDEYAYMPSNSYTANINEESSSKSEGALTKFTLTKNVDNDKTLMIVPKRNHYFFGKCKPGGCLDPPFGEDRQPYVPVKVVEPAENVIKEQAALPTVGTKTRTSSTFSDKFFNWKRKSLNDRALDLNVKTKETKAEPVLDLYHAGSLQTSATYSNSIMTYPPTLNSSEQLRIKEEKRGSRIYNDSSINSFNLHSGSYLIVPRNLKNVLDKNGTAKMEEDTDLKVDTIHKNTAYKTNITEQQDLKNGKKNALESKDTATTDVNTTEKGLMSPSGTKTKTNFNYSTDSINKKDFGYNNTLVIENNITKQQDIKDDETKHALETKDSATIIDVNKTARDLINPSESNNKKDFVHDKTHVDEKNVTNQQNLKENKTKYTLETYDLATIDVNIAESDLMISTESKSNEIFVNDPIMPLNTQTEQNESTNLLTAEESIPNLNLDCDFVLKKLKSVDSKSDAMIEYKSDHNAKIDVGIVKAVNADENSLVETVADYQKSTLVKAFDSQQQKDTEIENKMLSNVTIDVKREISVYDITKENLGIELALNIERKTSIDVLEVKGSMEIPNPIKRDSPLELINLDQDGLQQIWMNKNEPLQSETRLNIETEVNKKNNILLEPLNNKIDAFSSITKKASFVQNKTSPVLPQKKLNELMQNEYEKIAQNEIQSEISQTAKSDTTPIKRDSPLELINADEKGLLKIWMNKNELLKSDKGLNTETEVNMQDNILLEPLNHKIDEFGGIAEKESFGQNGTPTVLSQNKLNELMQNEYEQVAQNQIQSEISQTVKSDATPIKRDSPLELINLDENGLQKIWMNNNELLKSDTRFNTETEVNNQDNILLEPLYNKIDAFSGMADKESFGQNGTPTVLSQNKLNELMQNENEKVAQNEIQSEISQTVKSDATPIKRDSPLELMNLDENGLQKIWMNKNEPLKSDTKFNTETEVNKQDNILLEPLCNKIDAFSGIAEKESFGRTETQTVLPENSLNVLMQNEYEKVAQNEIQSVISQIVKSDALENIVEQNVSITLKALETLSKINAIDSVTRQKLEDFSFQRQLSTTPVVTKFKFEDIMNLTQYVRLSEGKKIVSGQVQPEKCSNIDPDNNIISSNYDTNLEEDGIHEFNRNVDNTLQQQPQQNFDTSETTQFITGQNKVDEKYIMIHKESRVAKPDQLNHFYPETDLNLDSKPDSQRTEAVSKTAGFDKRNPNEHSSSQAQASEITSKHKGRPILFNIAIQSYVDDANQVIIKSFDPNNDPHRYPQEYLKIIKRYLETDDIIEIPIDSENTVLIQIKNNKLSYIRGMEGNKAFKDNINKWVGNKYESELEHIKRNMTIAEDIRKILEAVYEKELLPLRNTITELKRNVEMLTMHHLVKRGHMFVKKPRSAKIVPLYRQCGCIKK